MLESRTRVTQSLERTHFDSFVVAVASFLSAKSNTRYFEVTFLSAKSITRFSEIFISTQIYSKIHIYTRKTLCLYEWFLFVHNFSMIFYF